MGDRIAVPDDRAFVVVGLLALAGAAVVVAGAVRGETTVAVGGGALATSGAVLAALTGARDETTG